MRKLFGVLIFSVCLLFISSSKIFAAEYTLTSSDGQVKVVLDSKFGGAITALYDYTDFGNLNLVNGYQAGAMFQSAFWTLPYHNYQPPFVNNDPRFPPGCTGMTGDQISDNPTQAGFVANGWVGNPIGFFGANNTDRNTWNVSGLTPDPSEFIQYEDGGKTIHFKSRFIRYDYCKNASAPMSERQWWDTDFYLEQWASFYTNLPRTLVLRSKISYTGAAPKSITSRQLPIIFACNLPRVAFWQNGQKTISLQSGETGINPDMNWSALIASDKEAGIGMVTSTTMAPMLGRGKFIYQELNSSINQCVNSGPLSVLFPGGGVPDLRTMGTVNNVDYDAASRHIFIFNPGGTFAWTTYYPVGNLPLIKTVSTALLNGLPSSLPVLSQINGSVNIANCTWTAGWAKDDRDLNNKLTMISQVFPLDDPNNKYTVSNVANSTRPDLTGVCPPSGQCAFGTGWGSFPSSFAGKKLSVAVYGKASNGQNVIFNNSAEAIGPCTNIQPSATPTSTPSPSPVPLPADLNSDGKVDIFDYNILVQNFGQTGSPGFIPADINKDGKVDIFDYNILVQNFGK